MADLNTEKGQANTPASNAMVLRRKRGELMDVLNHVDEFVRKRLPSLTTMLVQGCRGEMAATIRKDIAQVTALMKRINSQVLQFGGPAEKMRYHNLVHSFDAQMRSAELRTQDRERRRFSRVEIDLPVTMRHEGSRQDVRAVNMNLEGVKIKTGSRVPVGQTVELDMGGKTLPMSKVKAKVIWEREDEVCGYEAGVRFQGLDPQMKELIRRYLDYESEKGEEGA